MKRHMLLVAGLLLAWPISCRAEHSWTLNSPSSRLSMKIEQADGISYSVLLRGQEVI